MAKSTITKKAILENKFLYKTFLTKAENATASDLVEVTEIRGNQIIFKDMLDGASYKISASGASDWVKISDTKANNMLNKFIVNSKGEFRWLFNFVGGGFNSVWCKGDKRKAIKLAQESFSFDVLVPSFKKATVKSSRTWDTDAYIMTC